MSSKLSIQEIRALPKIDLHRHLDCSMRWSTLLEIATSLKLDLPKNKDHLRSHFLITEPMKDLESVLKKFLVAQKVLSSPEILERLAFEVCEDAFNDGVQWLELRYAPTFITEGHSHLTFDQIHTAFLKGIQQATRRFPIEVGLICIIQRNLPLKAVASVMDFALTHKDTFIGLDLADNEEGFEPKAFAPYFDRAKKENLHITIHSGESPSPHAGQWIKDSIELLHAERIGHGVQCIHFPEVLQMLIEKKITLEICLYSNYLTQAFKTYEAHPLKKLLDLNVPLTLNSDDPGMFNSTLTDDYLIAQNVHGFTMQDFVKCHQQAMSSTFIQRKSL